MFGENWKPAFVGTLVYCAMMLFTVWWWSWFSGW